MDKVDNEPRRLRHELSRQLRVADVPQTGLSRHIEATEEERRALARRYDIRAVTALSADFEVRPWRQHGYVVSGSVYAEVEQTCVVTLEPVAQVIDEPVERYFDAAVADADEGARPRAGRDPEIVVDPLINDPPDPLVGGMIDLGEIASEHVALALDPYPRKEGVVFEQVDTVGEDASDDSPFAALEALKRRTGSGT